MREVEEHEASGHVVHRSWCVYCQAARAMTNPHRPKPKDEVSMIPRVLIDYYFMGSEETMPMLAIKDEQRLPGELTI